MKIKILKSLKFLSNIFIFYLKYAFNNLASAGCANEIIKLNMRKRRELAHSKI